MIKRRTRPDPAKVQSPKDKKILRTILRGFTALTAIGIGTAIGGYTWLTSAEGRDWVRDIIVKQAGSDDMQLHIGKISELSLHGLRIDDIALIENGDALLAVDYAAVSINPYALLWKRIHITHIDVPYILFNRLPSASHDDASAQSGGLPDMGALSLPNMQIDKIHVGLHFADAPERGLTLKGMVNLDPNRFLGSHVELDVIDQNDHALLEARLLPDKNKPLLFFRLDDATGMLSTRFAGMEKPQPVRLTWQGMMLDSSQWDGTFNLDVTDMVSGDFAVKISDFTKNPVLAMNGTVAPVIVTDQIINLDSTLSSGGLEIAAYLDQWVEKDLLVDQPKVNFAMRPAVQFLVHQGYDLQIDAGFDRLVQNAESITPYTDALSLQAKGRLGRNKLSFKEITLGNNLWHMNASGYFHLVKNYLDGTVGATLPDDALKEIFGAYPQLSTQMRWTAEKGVAVDNGVVDIGAVTGQFNGVFDPEQKIVFHLNGLAKDLKPYFTGDVALNAVVSGTADNPEINLAVTSDIVTLESGIEIHGIHATFDGNLQQNSLALAAALDDGEYRVTTPIIMGDASYTFQPLQVTLPMGQIDGKLVVTQKDNTAIQADLRGHVEDQIVSLATAAEMDSHDDMSIISIKNLVLEWKKLQLRLKQAATITQQGDKTTWKNLSFNINQGMLHVADGAYAPDHLNLNIKAVDIPLAVADLPLEHGVLSGDLVLSGNQADPEFKADLHVRELVPPNFGTVEKPVSLSAIINGHFTQGNMQVHSSLDGLRGVRLAADVSVPMTLIPFNLEKDAKLSGKAKGQVDLMTLMGLALLDGHDVNGLADIDINLAGNVSSPVVTGNIRIADGEYENALYGTKLRHIALDVGVSVSELVIRNFTANDAKDGTLYAAGRVGLQPMDNPDIDITLRSKRMQILNSPSLAANASSDIFVKGRMDSLSISGDVNIHDAEVFTSDIAGSGDPYRDYVIIEKNLPASQCDGNACHVIKRAEKAHPIRMNIAVVAPNAIFVRGPGLDSEWKADLTIRGTTDRPMLNGSLSVLRGSYQFVDLLVRLNPNSSVVFTGNASNPELALKGTIPGRTLNAILSISGTVEKPVVELTSDQGLPSDEILARVLFGRSASGLSPAQALQVARVLARLSGQGGSGFDPVGVMRQALGVDTLGISMGDEDGAGPTVSAGKYISDDVYVSVEQGSTPNSSVIRSEIRLTDSIQVESEVNNAADSKIGIQWRWDY